MKSQFGKKFEVERQTDPGEPSEPGQSYIVLKWVETDGDFDDACFDPDKARELGQALIDAADDVKRCRCGRTV